MDNRDQFRREVEDVLRPQILAFTDIHLDLYDDKWHLYRQENMYDADVYYYTEGNYDASGVALIKQRLDQLREGRRYYFPRS